MPCLIARFGRPAHPKAARGFFILGEKMKDRISDKYWFPWWPDKWIFGSIRIEFSPAERGIWVDMLSLASKDSGHIRANEETPYPTQQLAGMLIIPEDILIKAIDKFIKFEKITKTKAGTLYVTKWEKYQFTERHKRRINAEMSEKSDTMSAEKDAIVKNNIKEDIIGHNKKEETKKTTATPKIIFNFGIAEFENIIKKDNTIWEKAYPACDIEAELNKMAAWLSANPTRKKSNYKKFITNWLSRQQDRGGSKTNGTEKWTPKEPQPWED